MLLRWSHDLMTTPYAVQPGVVRREIALELQPGRSS